MKPILKFDPVKYKNTTREQWQETADAWFRWNSTLKKWLGNTTETMLDMADIKTGDQVLDVAAGTGEQSITAAKRVGKSGSVLATDISSNILEYAKRMAQENGLENIETKVMDGENLTLEDEKFDAVISRVGLIYFPNQHQALKEMYRVLKSGGKIAAIVYSIPEKNKFFSIPISIIRNRAKLPPPLPGHPGPFSLSSESVIEKLFLTAGFINVKTELIDAPLQLSSAKECVRFERESFGALHQMMSNLSDSNKEIIWQEIELELGIFESENGFIGPCEMIIAVGEKPY